MSSRPRKGPKAAASPQGYRRLLKWAALPVTDRRWAAPLSAVALGFGLFVGVAIGPGAAGTFATGVAQIIEIPGFGGGTDSGEDKGGGTSTSAAAGEAGSGGGSAPEAESAFSPLAASEGEAEPIEATGPPTKSEPPASTEAPEAEEAETLTGIVLHVNPAAASYTIAEPSGTLDVLHAAKPPQPGTKVSVPVRLLANGTFAEAGKRTKSGERTRATFSGIVTYVDPTATAPAYTVSKRGVSALVRIHPDPSGAAPPLPVLGAFASVAVEIEKQPPASASASSSPESPVAAAESLPPVEPVEPVEPVPPPPPAEPAPAPPLPAPEAAPAPAPTAPSCAPDPTLPPLPTIQPSAILWQRQVKAQGAPFTYGAFAGIIEAVCPDSTQLLLSADDIRESGHDLLFAVPSTIGTAKLEVGQSVLATATIGSDGALSLTGLASDERAKGAEDAKSLQGDLAPKSSSARPRSSP